VHGADVSLWTPEERFDDNGGPTHWAALRPDSTTCTVDASAETGRAAPSPHADLTERTDAFRREFAGEHCVLLLEGECVRYSCLEEMAARWLELQRALPRACRLPCEGTIARRAGSAPP
jgi:hypothetical protein